MDVKRTKKTSKRERDATARTAAAAAAAPTIRRNAAAATSGGGSGSGGVSPEQIAADMAKSTAQWQTGEIDNRAYCKQMETLQRLRIRAIPEPDYENSVRTQILTAYVGNAPSGNSSFPKETQDRVSDLDNLYPDMRLFAKNLIDKNSLTNPDTHRPYRLTEILEKYRPQYEANMAYVSSVSAAAPERLEPFQNQSPYLPHLLTVAIKSVTQQLYPIGGIDVVESIVKSSDKGYDIMNVIDKLQPEPDSDLETKRRECIKYAMILQALSDKSGNENTQITDSTKEIMKLCKADNILEYYNTMR